MQQKKELTLKVMEALQEEVYKGIVRIDSETMHLIDVRPGDIVEIEGNRITVGIVDRAYPTDVGQAVIRMDGILRRNARTGIGEIVKVRKADVKEAKSLVLAPAQEGVMIQANPEIFKRSLLGRAAVKGDILVIGGPRRRRRPTMESSFEDIMGVFEETFIGNFNLGNIKFIVVDTNPKAAVIISENSQISISPKAVEVREEKIPEVTYEDLGGLDEEIKKIREMVELPLKHPEIFTRLGIDPPSGVLLHGPPGSGKTLLAKAVANESEANFILVNGPEIMNKFYGECVATDSMIITNGSGLTTIKEAVESNNTHKIVSVDMDSQKTALLPVSDVYDKGMQQTLKIYTPHSMIELTPTSKLLILNKGIIKWIFAKDLKKNEKVAIANSLPKMKEVLPNILDFVEDNTKFSGEWIRGLINLKGDNKKVANILNVTPKKVQDLKYHQAAPAWVIRNLNIKSPIDSLKLSRKGKIPTTITEDLMYLLGLLAGDGHLRYGYKLNQVTTINFTNADQNVIREFKKIVNGLFGINNIDYDGKYGYYFSSRPIGRLLMNLGIPAKNKAKTIKVPNYMISMPKGHIAAYLRGLFDTDGHVHLVPSGMQLSYYTSSKEMLIGVKYLLLRFDIQSTFRYRKDGTYELTISDFESIKIFKNYINFNHATRKERLNKKLTNKYKKPIYNRQPIKDVIIEIKNKHKIGNRELIKLGLNPYVNSYTRHQVKKLIKVLSNLNEDKDLINRLNVLNTNDIIWSPINLIEESQNHVYDFTVPKYHNFIANGFVVHNSEKRIRDIFEDAEHKAPSIIFIDEIDAIAPKREETHGEVERRVVAQILCLDPNTPIYLKNKIRLIKELFEETKGREFIKNGVVYKLPSNEIFVQGLSSSGKISNNRIIALTKSNVLNAFKITLANGNEITTSEITKFLVIDNQGVYWKNANEIKISDYLMIPKKLDSTGKIHKINIFNLKEKEKWIVKVTREGLLFKIFDRKYVSLYDIHNLKEFNRLPEGPKNNIRIKILNILLSKNEITKEHVEEKLNINRASLNNYLRKLERTSIVNITNNKIRLAISLDYIDNEIVAIAKKENKLIYPIKESYFIPIPKILDEDLGKLLGLLISDGNLSKSRFNIFGETSLIAYKLCNKLFSDKNISFDVEKSRLDIYSKPFVDFINEYFGIPIGKKSQNVKIPDIIYDSPESVKASLLAGILEGDGTVENRIIFNTKSKELAFGISRLLLQLGILSKIKKYDCFAVKISGGYESYEKFLDKILEFVDLNRKKKKLLEFNKRIKQISTIIYPIKETLKRIRDENQIRLDDNMYRYLSPNLSYNINSYVLGYFIKKLGKVKNQFIQEVTQLQGSEVIPCQVVSVETTSGGIMYDLTTENSNFLAGNLPIIVHNTAMDGLKTRKNVVVIGATNRPNAIDPALRRPGRFDREIAISVPNKKGRLEIFKIHSRNMPLDYWDNATAGKTIYKFIENLNGESRLEMRKQKLIEESLALTKKQETKEKELSELKKEEAKIRKYPTESNKKQDYQISVLKPQKISDRLKEIFSLKPKIEDELNSIISNINRLKNELEYLDKQQITIKKNLETLSKIPKLQKEILIKSEDLEEILHIRDIRDSGDIRQQFYTIKDVEINSDLSEGIKTILEQLVLLKIIEQQEVENLKSDIKDASLDVLRDNLAKITHGFVGADISSLAKEAAMNVLRRILPEINLKEKEPIPKELLERLRVAEEDFKEALKIVRPSALREVLIENPNIRWADIGGLDAIKDNLREVIEWPLKYIEEFKKLGIKPPRGILLYGLPGTGKTLLAKAVATESQANFISVKGPSLINMWLGESERGIRKIFEKARQSAPTVIFFDEIDAIAPRRISGSRTTERIVNTLLSEMDGLEKLNDVIIIAATNRPDILDPALLRPGRFDKIVSVPMPDLNSRIEILKVHTSKMPMTKDVDVHKIAQITTNFTGADLEALTRESGMTALRRYISETETIKGISKERSLKKVTIKKPKLEVTSEDFEEALKNVKPSITTDDLKRYQEIEEEYVRTVRAANIKQVPQPYFG